MNDTELKELAKKTWEQYWGMTMLTGLGGKFPESIVPFFKQFFESGFIEGFRTREETADK